MDTAQLVSAIDDEISRLHQVKELLTGQTSTPSFGNRPRKKRTLSAEARERIAAAQRKRWAAQKKKSKAAPKPKKAARKKAAKKSAPPKTETPAAS